VTAGNKVTAGNNVTDICSQMVYRVPTFWKVTFMISYMWQVWKETWQC